MKKVKIKNVCLISKFKKHTFYKDKLLKLFSKHKENIKQVDNYYSDSISNYDWDHSKDKNREWVKLIIDDLMEHFNNCANYLGYGEINLYDLWFQQYKKNDTHGWHIHGYNYTGVYYLDYNKDSANTQLVSPFNQNEIINVDSLNVKEGDIILFPSSVIHRANIQKSNNTKTIISFNFDFNLINKEVLKNINSKQ